MKMFVGFVVDTAEEANRLIAKIDAAPTAAMPAAAPMGAMPAAAPMAAMPAAAPMAAMPAAAPMAAMPMPAGHPAAVTPGMQGQVNPTGDARDQLIVYLETKARSQMITAEIGAHLNALYNEVGHSLSLPPAGTQGMDQTYARVRAIFGEA